MVPSQRSLFLRPRLHCQGRRQRQRAGITRGARQEVAVHVPRDMCVMRLTRDRMRECGWANKFTTAMAALQVIGPAPRVLVLADSSDLHRRPTRHATAAPPTLRRAGRRSCCRTFNQKKASQCRCCNPPPPPPPHASQRCVAEQIARLGRRAAGAGLHSAVAPRA